MNASSLATSFLHFFNRAPRELVAAPQFTGTSHAGRQMAASAVALRSRTTPLIMVVDRDSAARQRIGRGLQHSGTELLQLKSLAECFDAAPILKPDLILLNLPMALAENVQSAALRECAAKSGNPPVIFLGFGDDAPTLARVSSYLDFQQRRLKIEREVAEATSNVPAATRIFTETDLAHGKFEATPPSAEAAAAPQDLAPVVRLAEWIFQPIAANRQITLKVTAPTTGLMAAGDEVRIQRVLENLLSNAIKYSPAGSTVTLGAQVKNNTLRFWVDDEGPGVPLSEQAGLFEDDEHFLNIQDADDSSDSRGLLVCQHIAALHHGRMEMYNRLEGGAHFELRLPAASPPVAQPTTDQVTPLTASAQSGLVTMNLCPPSVA